MNRILFFIVVCYHLMEQKVQLLLGNDDHTQLSVRRPENDYHVMWKGLCNSVL